MLGLGGEVAMEQPSTGRGGMAMLNTLVTLCLPVFSWERGSQVR